MGGRIGDFGWWLRDSGGVIALVLALLALGAGVAGLVVALDAKDKAEGAAAAAVATTSTPPLDASVQASVDDLNERVAQIEESVSQLRTEAEGSGTSTTTPDEPPGGSSPPDVPQLPENLPDIPGIGAPESESPPKP